MPHEPTVLLLDEAFMSGAYTALALRSAGCRVSVLSAAGGRGRAPCDWRLAPRVGDPALARVIEAELAGRRYDVVYPVTEPLQQLLAGRGIPYFPSFDAAQRSALGDKRRMSALVAHHGGRVPLEHSARHDDDIRTGAARLGLPLVVKGSAGRGGAGMAIVTSIAAAIRAARAIRARGVIPFLQTYVDGPTYLAGGLFDRGEPLRFYAARKTVQFPRRTGPAAELVSFSDPAFAAAALAAFRASRMTGIASVDFVRDRDGNFHFLELNPRPWGSIRAAADAGVELFAPLVDLWLGARVRPSLGFKPGVRSAVFPLFVLSSDYWRRGAAGPAIRENATSVYRTLRREPALALHIAHRLVRVGLNWS